MPVGLLFKVLSPRMLFIENDIVSNENLTIVLYLQIVFTSFHDVIL